MTNGGEAATGVMPQVKGYHGPMTATEPGEPALSPTAFGGKDFTS